MKPGQDDITKNYHGGADTSEQAFLSTPKEARAAIRTKVLDTIRRAGLVGMICDEVESKLKLTHQTASARCTELKALDLIVDSGIRRRTRSGSFARVYIEAKMWHQTQLNLFVDHAL